MNSSLFWRVVPYRIYGVSLFAIERDGYILKYCDTKDDACAQCDNLNKLFTEATSI